MNLATGGMRVLWTSPHCWPDYTIRPGGLGTKSQGGQSVVMYHNPIAMAQLDPSMHIDIFARHEDGEPQVKELGGKELGGRVRLIRLPLGPTDTYLPKEEFWGKPIEGFVDRVDEFAQEHGLTYDLIHGHYADGWYVVNKLGKRWGVPYCCTTHSLGKRKQEDCRNSGEGTEAELNKEYAFDVRIPHEMEALEAAARIIPLTIEEGEYILEHYNGTRRDQIVPIGNGVVLKEFDHDNAQIAALRKDVGLADDDFVVLQMGRNNPRKGQKQLLEAAPAILRRVKDKTGKNVRFLFLGWEPSEYTTTLESLIDQLGIRSDVILHGPVSNIETRPFLGLAALAGGVYALTSTYDIFPIVMLETMASFLPIVATKNGGPSEVIRHGENGLLVNPLNTDEVADAVTSLLFDTALRESFTKEARRDVENNYTWEKISKKLLPLYQQIIAERNARPLKSAAVG